MLAVPALQHAAKGPWGSSAAFGMRSQAQLWQRTSQAAGQQVAHLRPSCSGSCLHSARRVRSGSHCMRPAWAVSARAGAHIWCRCCRPAQTHSARPGPRIGLPGQRTAEPAEQACGAGQPAHLVVLPPRRAGSLRRDKAVQICGPWYPWATYLLGLHGGLRHRAGSGRTAAQAGSLPVPGP